MPVVMIMRIFIISQFLMAIGILPLGIALRFWPALIRKSDCQQHYTSHHQSKKARSQLLPYGAAYG